VHAVDTNWPEQVLQPVHDAALVAVEKFEPEVQDGQTVSEVEVQTALLYFPATQTVQVAGADEPARQKLPAGQAI
jgi:hypothetical protein